MYMCTARGPDDRFHVIDLNKQYGRRQARVRVDYHARKAQLPPAFNVSKLPYVVN